MPMCHRRLRRRNKKHPVLSYLMGWSHSNGAWITHTCIQITSKIWDIRGYTWYMLNIRNLWVFQTHFIRRYAQRVESGVRVRGYTRKLFWAAQKNFDFLDLCDLCVIRVDFTQFLRNSCVIHTRMCAMHTRFLRKIGDSCMYAYV